ncbi:MAG TPA: hypothetical protein VMU45_08965 [Candidatus Eisenbacteria bacterium]|nr:hypothetical protein [Candidatus Eisenbacteria bacterium]
MGFLNMLFGCPHKKLSFPITVRGAARRRSAATSLTGTYVVCLECGHEFPYDWNQMKVVRETSPAPTPGTVTVQPRRVA